MRFNTAVSRVAQARSQVARTYQLCINNFCLDVDECTNSTLNTCESQCMNALGGYICVCPDNDGYQLAPDRRSCIRESDLGLACMLTNPLFVCNVAICNRACQNGGTCYSPHRCACPLGFSGSDCRFGKSMFSKDCFKVTKVLGLSCLHLYSVRRSGDG